MKRNALIIFLALALILAAASCAKPTEPADPGDPSKPAEPVKPANPDDPAKPADNADQLKVGFTDEDSSYSYTYLFGNVNYREYSDGLALAFALGRGETDTAVIPTNLACRLYRETDGKVAIVAISLAGDIWLVENGGADMSIADTIGPDTLYGRTVYIPYEGGAEDAIARSLIKSHDLAPGETVSLEYLSYDELAEQVKSEEGSFACLPEPMNESFDLGFSASWAWASENGKELCPLYCVAVNTETITEEELAMVKSALAESSGYITGEYDLMDNITPYLRDLYNVSPELIGGYMPDDAIYR